MISEDAMREHLNRFLAPHGRHHDDLVKEVDRGFGQPKLVVVAGSVLQGFGNPASDVDLHVIVDDGRVTDFHLSFHDLGFAVDVNYVEQGWIEQAALDDAPPLTNRAEFTTEQRRVTQLGRFALGLPLAGATQWLDWRAELVARYAARAARLSRNTALRHLIAARELAPHDPLLAAQCYCDAGLAVLTTLAAHAGEPYVNTKWLGLKLDRMGATELLDDYDRYLDLPCTRAQAPDYLAWAEEAIAASTADWGLAADPVIGIAPAPGVEVWRVRDRHLVHRFGLAGLELVPSEGERVADALTWSGPLSQLSDTSRALLREELVWLAVLEDA